MTKSERRAEQLKKERADRRHREFVDRLRSERNQRTAAQRRLEERREGLRGRDVAEWRQLREAAAAEREATQAMRARQVQQISGQRKTLEEERQQRLERRRALAVQTLERRRQLQDQAKAAGSAGDSRPPTAEQRKLGRQALEQERVRQLEVRKALRRQRVQEQRQLRGIAEPVRAARPAAAERHNADRKALEDHLKRRSDLRQAAAARRLEEHRRLGDKTGGARERLERLRARLSEQRSSNRKDREQEHRRLLLQRQSLGALRVQEQRQSAKSARTSTRRVAVLRPREVARPASERKARLTSSAAFSPLTRARAAGMSTASSTLPREELLWLSAVDSFIVDENGLAVTLRGINVVGLDTAAPGPEQGLSDALSLDEANVAAITGFWGANLVRLPFTAQTILSGNGALSHDEILAGLDETVTILADAGVYTLLALRADAPPPGVSTAPSPDQSAFDCWSLLARRYQGESAALFEIFSSTLPIAGDWLQAAPRLIGSIRREHPASLLFVGNGSGGPGTGGLPLRFTTGEPTPNLVYTIRVAPQFSADDEAQLAGLSGSFPVFASEWSSGVVSEFDRSAELATIVFGRFGLGWAASSWNAEPRLVVNPDKHDFVPTRWGLAVQRAMTLPAKLLPQPLLPENP